MSEMFAEEFSDEMAKQFQETMKGLLGNDPKMKEQIEKLAEAAEKTGMCDFNVFHSSCTFFFRRGGECITKQNFINLQYVMLILSPPPPPKK